MFQSLIGRLQTPAYAHIVEDKVKFQSLIGRLQTFILLHRYSSIVEVSIPHR